MFQTFLVANVMLCIFLYLRIMGSKPLIAPDGGDYLNFYTGAAFAKSHNLKGLFDVNQQIEFQKPQYELEIVRGFRSLPFVAIIMSPLAQVEFSSSAKIFLNITLFIFFLFAFFYNKTDLKNLSVQTFLALSFLPFIMSLYAIQVTFYIAIVIALARWAIINKRDVLAGIFCAGLLIKPHFLLIAVMYLPFIKKKLKFVLGLGAMATILLLLGTGELGNYLPNYLTFVLNTETLAFGTGHLDLVSLQGLLVYFFEPAQALKITIITTAFLVPISLKYLNRGIKSKINSDNTLLLAATMLGLALSIHHFKADYIILYFALWPLYKTKYQSLFWTIYIMLNILPNYLMFLIVFLIGTLLTKYKWEDTEIWTMEHLKHLIKYPYERFKGPSNYAS